MRETLSRKFAGTAQVYRELAALLASSRSHVMFSVQTFGQGLELRLLTNRLRVECDCTLIILSAMLNNMLH